jgi:lipoprotein NlpI
MMKKDPATMETWELGWSLRNHRAFARCFRFALISVVVLLLAGLAVAPPVLAQSSASDWVNSGNAKYEKGDLDGAVADYSRAIEIDPKYAMAYFNRGVVKGIKDDLDGAVADYSRAIEIDPKYEDAYINRGVAKGKKGDLDGEIADYNRAIEIDPEYAVAYLNRGLAKRTKGDLDGAVADYSRAIEIEPEYAVAYSNRGNAKSEKGDSDGAVSDYSRAIEIDPKYAVVYSNRGNVFQAKGQFDRAAADFNKAFELNTKDEYACLRLLIATWLAKGDTGGATATLRKHIDANNSDDWVRTISKYYVGIDNLNEQAVLSEARKGKDGKEVGERLCEAYYYLGVKRLVAGNRKGAAEYFTLSIGTDVKSFQEYNASKAMLTLMKEGKIAGAE